MWLSRPNFQISDEEELIDRFWLSEVFLIISKNLENIQFLNKYDYEIRELPNYSLAILYT